MIRSMNELITNSESVAWPAHLRLRFTREGARTILRERRHQGPLRVLKALYPEGEGIAHAVIVHPPAGIAGGDALTIKCSVEANAHAVITTPGAQKWYRARAHVPAERHAQAVTTIDVATGACLEWLPQEAMIYDGCIARQCTLFNLAPGAKMLAWEALQWGRTARGEQFSEGEFGQSFEIRVGGELVWQEKMRVAGGASLLVSPAGFGGHAVNGNLWVAGASDSAACLAQLRELCANAGVDTCGATSPCAGLIVVKIVVPEIELLRTFFVQCRNIVRPFLCEAPAVSLRLWAT